MSFQNWHRFLIAITIGVMIYGLVLMIAPDAMQTIFRVLFFPALGTASFGASAHTYLTLVQGVLGAVIVGWMTTFLLLLVWMFRAGERSIWRILAVSLTIWFVADSGFSVLIGSFAHALFNVVFAVLFAVPLAATYRACHSSSHASVER